MIYNDTERLDKANAKFSSVNVCFFLKYFYPAKVIGSEANNKRRPMAIASDSPARPLKTVSTCTLGTANIMNKIFFFVTSLCSSRETAFLK